ncbi:hypothetical protein [Flavivirga jejuensis]|uniref:Uncharacterized protein n=1 Tax=Flavivirga jejuensis TaxID=870487 RepID=A0ABT8WPX4_9FLAO|nr:hypothetical protein [Flavivirga jejuensis]MDO5975039.1 hypothetical protein [Flavivirga jejuensis]
MNNKVINLFDNKIVPNKGVKYSELLEQFMSPFTDEFIDAAYIDDIFEFSMNAWNMANINIMMPNEDIEKEMNAIEQEGEDISLLKKMIAHKEEKYKVFTNFIIDYELKEPQPGKAPMLSVVTQEEHAYLSDMVNEIKEEENLHYQEDYHENYINRSAIVLKPQQPFLDWFSNLNPDEDFEEELKETNIYLVDDTIDDVEKWLKKKFDTFFMMELEEWHGNKKEWPQKRNYKMFNLWFRVEISKMIYDLEKKPVLKSE